MKRSISLLLVLAMLISMLPMGAFAEEILPEPEEQEQLQYERPAPEPETREELPEQVPEQSETAPEEVDSEVEAGTSVQDTEAASQDDPAEPEDDVLQSAPMEALAEMIEDAPEEQGIIASGTCGENLIWELDEEGTLTISGSGAMTNYKSVSDTSSEKPIVPWARYSSQIHTLKIESGVSSIGSCAFHSCLELENVSIPDTVTAIGQEAFYLCAELTGVKLPSGLTQIFPGSFVGCYKLSNIVIPDGVTVIGKDAFKACTGLLRAVIPASVQRIEQDAFLNCTQLRDVYYFGSEGMWEKLADEPILSNSTIHFDYGPYSLTYNANGGSNAPADRTQVGTLSISSEMAVWEGHEFLGWARSAHAAQADYGAGDTITLTQDTVLFAVWGVEQIASGTCGENVVWTLDGNGTLTISGTGAMGDYTVVPWEDYRGAIKHVEISEGVSSIAGAAFDCCTNLESISIADSVTLIGSNAFRNCESLKSITIPDSVTTIGFGAFYSCSGLTGVSISGSVTAIGDFVFRYCTKLDNVVIPEGVLSIGNGAFQGCTAMKSVTIPDSIKTIDSSAFRDCTGLLSVTIPNSVTVLGPDAFNGCIGLTSVTIPGSIKGYASSAFRDCAGLKTVIIQDGRTYIDNYAFSGCTSLETVVIPKSITEIQWDAFENCTSLHTIYYTGTEADWERIWIRSDNAPLLNAKKHWCYGDYTLTLNYNDGSEAPAVFAQVGTVQIPEDVPSRTGFTFIGWATAPTANSPEYPAGGFITLTADTTLYALWDTGATAAGSCGDSLCWVYKSGTLTVYGSGAMANYTYYDDTWSDRTKAPWTAYRTKISRVVLNEGVTSVGDNAFNGCISLENVIFPDSLQTIGQNAFSGCTAIGKVQLPSNLKNLGNSAFSGCSSLTGVVIPDGLAEIPASAFSNTSVKVIAIPASVKTIGDGAFWNVNAEKLVFAEGLEEIENSAFDGYRGKVSLPASVRKIESYAFFNCTEVNLGGPLPEMQEKCFANARIVRYRSDFAYDLTLYEEKYYAPNAVWAAFRGEDMPYSIRYDANGGEYPPAPQNKIPGESLTLALSKPWYAGKRFMGWALDANASTARYQPGGVYSADEDAVLYAVWGNAGTTPDTTAPVLKSIILSAASVDAPGDIDVVADVTDAVSGVNYGWIYFKNAAANKTVVVDLRTTYYDESRWQELSYTDGRLHGKLKVSEFLPGGKYTISQAEFVDRADNRVLYGTFSGWKALPTACKATAFTVNESNPDVTAPELLELYFSASSVTAPGSIEVIADAVDDNSGVDRMFVNLISQEGRQITAYLESSFYDSMTGEEIPYPDGKLHGKLTLDEFVPGGTYSVRYIDLYDAADNVSFYSDNKNIVNAVPLPVFCRNISLLVRSFGAQVNTSTDAPDFADQIRSAGNDAHIAADYSGCSVVHADVFDALMGTDKVLDLYSGNVVWRFEGQSITDPTKDVELSVQISPVSVGSATANALALEFANNANLPGPAQVRVHLDNGQQNYLISRNLQLWYYNAAAGTLELIAASVPMSDDGTVSFTINHCSTYLLLPAGTRLNASIPSRSTGSWNGVQWRYDASVAALYLSGFGIMADADRPYNAPWFDFADRVKYLVVGADIAALGADCFTNLNQLQAVFYCGGIPGGIDANSSLHSVPKVRYADEICLAQVESVDISRPDVQVQLAVSFLPEGSTALVTFRAEGQNLSVDADGKVTFTGKSGSGSVFAADALGIAQGTQTQIETYYYTGTSNFHIDTDVPCTDMRVNDSAQVRVFADEDRIPDEMLHFTLESGENVIDLKENGSFTAKAVGNAVIRGELNGTDPLGRRAVITVQVTKDDCTAAFEEANENGELLLQMQPGAVQTYALHLKNASGAVDGRAYTFTTGDAKVAKVALNKNTGDITLTVPKGAYGTAVITARPVDAQYKNSVTTLAVHVRNYNPRLSAAKVTMNSYKTCGVSVPIFPAYEPFCAEPGQMLEVYEKTKTGYVSSEVFTASFGFGTLEIHTVDDMPVSNRTASLRVKIPTMADDGQMLRNADLTVTVKNSLPKVTVKQTAKPNLFIRGSVGKLVLTCKSAAILDAQLDIAGYDVQFADDTLMLTPAQLLLAKSGRLEVTLEGYNKPVVIARQTVAAVNTKPGLVLAKTSGTIHGAGSGEITLTVRDKATKLPADLQGVTAACVQEGFTAEVNDDGRIVLKADSSRLKVAKKTAYKLNLTLHHDDWAAAVPLSYTLSVLAPSTVPTGKLSASSITLNSRYPENCGRVTLIAGNPNLPVTGVKFLNLPKQLAMEYDAGSGAITAQLMDAGLPNGSYAVTCRFLCDGQTMKDLKLTVKVINSAAAVTAAASGKLDLMQPEKTMAYALTIKNLNMAMDSVKQVRAISPAAALSRSAADGSQLFEVTIGRPNAKGLPTVNVKLKPGVVYSTKTTYKLRLQCTTACGAELTTADLSIKLTQSKMKIAAAVPSASIYPMGDVFIGYRINVTSAVGRIEKIALDTAQTGADNKTLMRGIDTLTWSISEDGRSASVSVVISREPGLVAGKTYTLPLLITPANADPATKPIRQNLTIKILK